MASVYTRWKLEPSAGDSLAPTPALQDSGLLSCYNAKFSGILEVWQVVASLEGLVACTLPAFGTCGLLYGPGTQDSG